MTAFERWALWITAAATTLTGLGYLWPKYFIEPSDPWAVINHPWQPVALKAHIIVAPLFVFVLGAVVLKHAVTLLAAGGAGRRPSGVVLLGFLVPMMLSGYLIQVLTNETAVKVTALIHIGTSLAFTAGLALHAVRERASEVSSQGTEAAQHSLRIVPGPGADRGATADTKVASESG